MKPVVISLITVLSLLMISCFKLGKDQYYIKMTGAVEISHVEIPDTVISGNYALIKATAQAYDACWSNLTFKLDSTTNHEYTLQAMGTYESYGSCQSLMVYGDTAISLKMTKPGLYKFYTYMNPETTQIDTMIVR